MHSIQYYSIHKDVSIQILTIALYFDVFSDSIALQSIHHTLHGGGSDVSSVCS